MKPKHNTAIRFPEPTALDRLRTENARRVKCGQCDLLILPESMERHVRICHDWGEA